MLLTISTTHQPATDLGFLLHKHPDKLQAIDLSIGKAQIFYPESSAAKTTIALLLDIDPIALVRGSRNLTGKGFSLGQYVNDRPYVASSFMSVAIAKAFSTAMNGHCKKRPDLVSVSLPLEVKISVLPTPKGGEILIRKLFEPLGYTVDLERHVLDEEFPEWGNSKYYTVSLKNTIPLQALLSHLYVLIPALANDKHYYVSQNEIDKLLAKGKSWLPNHPEKEQITRRYLIHLGSFTKQALARLSEGTEKEIAEEASEAKSKKNTLHQQRLALVVEQLKTAGAKSVLDLGCGEGKLIRRLLKHQQFKKIVGMDVSYSELLKCKERLHWEEMAPRQKARIELLQGALTYQDKRLSGFDAAALVEVIEHLDENRLQAFERVVFEFAQPKTIILTTPNAAYNVRFEQLKENTMRHHDHRFEWTRKTFEAWATKVAKQYNYTVSFLPIGEFDAEVGAPSQMGIFNYGN
ncbi:MAG: 3' terminal RNA ribose 2'-O-methyltransferase Hen1 [Saprospiraceae bacterium]